MEPFRVEAFVNFNHMLTIGHENLIFSDTGGDIGLGLFLRGEIEESCSSFDGCKLNAPDLHAESIWLKWLNSHETFYWTSEQDYGNKLNFAINEGDIEILFHLTAPPQPPEFEL